MLDSQFDDEIRSANRDVIIKNTRITNTDDFYHKEHRKFEFSIANTRFS